MTQDALLLLDVSIALAAWWWPLLVPASAVGLFVYLNDDDVNPVVSQENLPARGGLHPSRDGKKSHVV
jgi:hypothetical protein